MSVEKFDLARVQQFFEESLVEDEEDVQIENYIRGYLELYKYVSIISLIVYV